jgi:endoglucanase
MEPFFCPISYSNRKPFRLFDELISRGRNQMREQAVAFLKDLVATPAPSGGEQAVARLYHDYVAPFADETKTDVMGNVAAVLQPEGRMKIMLAAHMDEIGYMVHYIGEGGFLHVSAIGGNDAGVAQGQRVWVHGRERIAGVFGAKAMHLETPKEMTQKKRLKDLWIDIGALSRAEAETVVAIGDLVTVQSAFSPLLGDRATGRAFDNKAGLVVIAEALRLLKEEPGLHPDVAVYAVATVQEEIGSRGATTSAFGIDPQTTLAVDMGQALDVPGSVVTERGEFLVGQGPGITRGANTNQHVFSLLVKAAQDRGIPYQVNAVPGTNPTDARVLQISRTGTAAGMIEIPLRYMHTPSEVISLADVEHGARLMADYCRLIRPDTDFRPQSTDVAP